MNYIKRLERDLDAAEAEVKGLRRGIARLREYLFSDKFREDTTVQRRDVLNRLADAITEGNLARDEALLKVAKLAALEDADRGAKMRTIKAAWRRGCSFEDEADGFGEGAGTFGDWSGIRDSSGEAVDAMFAKAVEHLGGADEVVGYRHREGLVVMVGGRV